MTEAVATTRLLMTADAVGGVWQYATDLARGLAAHGIETVLAVMGPSPSEAQRTAAAKIPGLTLLDTGLPLDWTADSADDVLRAGEAVAALAERHEVDLVHLNTPALAAEASFPVPVVAVAHSCVATWWSAVKGGVLPEDFAWRTALVRAGLHAADRVAAPSAAFAAATHAAYKLAASPAAIHNGRRPLTLPQAAPHDFAFTAGRLWDEGKNLAVLDRAAARLGVPLRAAGPTRGPNGASIDLVHVHRLGNLDEARLGRWLAARPVFVSAARYEPFGLAVLEAAMAGCALVLSDIPTFRELWADSAMFVSPDDDRGFARAVQSLIEDGHERARLGYLAKQRAQLYSTEAMAAATADLYRSLVSVDAARAAA